ncbi:MAG TPA: PspC domain-containing protein [Roseiflexaceae bacterium]|jgi:phage shock protein C|nr:PspC domain-containing protein [Roseiflexaceae bacterium]
METRLVRSRDDKIIAGVCGGIARALGVDSTVVRLVFVLSIFAVGVSPLIYVILWIVMPEEAPATSYSAPAARLQDPTGEWQYDPYTGERLQK